MHHLNGKFLVIKGNPTTNYAMTDKDHEKSDDFHFTHKSEMPHESYLGEYKQKL